MQWDRRSALAALAAAAVPISSLVAAADAAGTKLVLLGTAGGPRVRKNRSGSAQAIVSDGNIYVIDCGGQSIMVQNMRLAGTLVLLNTGSNSAIQGSVNMAPSVANYPTLLVSGSLGGSTAAGCV